MKPVLAPRQRMLVLMVAAVVVALAGCSRSEAEAPPASAVPDVLTAQARAADAAFTMTLPARALHTPGHTPGSQCFLANGCLVSGDTLFLDGCGRTDLPGSNPSDMYDSLQRLASLPDDTVVFPGHQYSPAAQDSMVRVRSSNAIFKPKSKEAWLGWFGG